MRRLLIACALYGEEESTVMPPSPRDETQTKGFCREVGREKCFIMINSVIE